MISAAKINSVAAAVTISTSTSRHYEMPVVRHITVSRPPTSLAVVIGSRRRAFDSSRLLLPRRRRGTSGTSMHMPAGYHPRRNLRCLMTRNRKESSRSRLRMPFLTNHEINDKRTDRPDSDLRSRPDGLRVGPTPF